LTWGNLIIVLIVVVSFLAGFGLHRFGLVGEQQHEAINIKSPIVLNKPETDIGMPRPDFELKDIDGNQRHIKEWQGDVIAINFWATWCPPCLEEIPAFIELQNQYQGRGLQFIGIAMQEADEIRDYSQEVNISYPLLVGAEEVMKVSKIYGNDIGALPYTVIIDRDGKIAFQKRGPISKSEAEKVILSLL